MLIHKQKQALLFKLKEPSKLTTVLPTAKTVMHKGYPLVAVPHRPDETRVLRNMGYEVPDPMKMYYPFEGMFKPFAAQVETANFLTMHHRAYCLNSMGLGKTVTSLWAFDYMRKAKQVKRALIVCPLSTMEDTWAKEVFRTFPHMEVGVLYGSRERRIKLLKKPFDVYVVNHDGVKAIKDELKDRDDIDLIIIDELAVYRNASTDRWKCLNEVVNKQVPRKAWGLTGAPIPHEPTDAWAQCRLVCPDHPGMPKYFSKFRDMVMRQVNQYKWVAKENALDVVHELMQPSIRFALDDCVDLPEQIFVTREVQMSDEQKAAYKTMLSKLKAEFEGGEILAVNEAVKANKLLQISLGVAYSNDGQNIVLPAGPRMEVLKEIIEESEGKVLVFVPLTGALERVAEELSHDWTVATVHGGTPKNQRDEIFRSFQTTDEPHVLVANPGTMSHGLTLTAATTIVWFGPVNSNDVYVQACARVRRPGQKRSTVIVHLVGSEIERRCFERLRNKQSTQNILLDMLKEQEVEA